MHMQERRLPEYLLNKTMNCLTPGYILTPFFAPLRRYGRFALHIYYPEGNFHYRVGVE